MAAQATPVATPVDTVERTVDETPRGAWKITFLLFLFMLVNDREIMGPLVSPVWANVLSSGVVFILTAAGVLFGISVIAPNIFAALGGR